MPDCPPDNVEPLQRSPLAVPMLNPPVLTCPPVLLKHLFQHQHFKLLSLPRKIADHVWENQRNAALCRGKEIFG